jgi:hypothetical protein
MKQVQKLMCCVLLLVACGKDEPKDRTRSEFCHAWAEAACSAETLSACQSADAEACTTSQEDACLERVPASFSDAKGDACLEGVKAAYADADLQGDELATVLRLAGPCAGIVVGPKSTGQSCDEDNDCDGSAGFTCVVAVDREGSCQKAEVTQGGRDCSAPQTICEVGFYCDGDNCVESKDPEDECTIQAECGTGFCNDAGKCEARRKVSESCTEDLECGDGVCYVFEDKKSCTDRIILARSEPLCDELR